MFFPEKKIETYERGCWRGKTFFKNPQKYEDKIS